MQEITTRQDNSYKIEKTRLISDNYNAYIIAYANNKRIAEVNLSDNGLKQIRWEAREEVRTWKPCTRLEEIMEVEIKGFDFDFTFAKNSPDIMKILMDQHRAYYGGFNIEKNINQNSNINQMNKVLKNLRTSEKQVAEVNVQNKIVAEGITNFNQSETFPLVSQITPTFDLKINIQHYNDKIESYLFKGFKLYKPTQSTAENGEEIIESCKGFASTVVANGNINFSPTTTNLIHNMLQNMFNSKSNDLLYHDRKILNKDNFNIYKNAGKFQF